MQTSLSAEKDAAGSALSPGQGVRYLELLNLDEVLHLKNHATDGRVVDLLHGIVQTLEAESSNRCLLVLRSPDPLLTWVMRSFLAASFFVAMMAYSSVP